MTDVDKPSVRQTCPEEVGLSYGHTSIRKCPVDLSRLEVKTCVGVVLFGEAVVFQGDSLTPVWAVNDPECVYLDHLRR